MTPIKKSARTLGMDANLLVGVLGILALIAVVAATWYFARQKNVAKPKHHEVGPARGDTQASKDLGQARKVDLARGDTQAPTAEAMQPQPRQSLWQSALQKTRTQVFGRLETLLSGKSILSEQELEGLEEILYTSDLGPRTIERLMELVRTELKNEGGSGAELVRARLKQHLQEILKKAETVEIDTATQSPFVIMIVGVNGAGKTTTIGKLAARLAGGGKKVLVAAGDTFRAAAQAQLQVWSERAQVEIFGFANEEQRAIQDPSALAFAALEYGKAKGFDVILVDTAGRLHTQKNLMEELKKTKRVMSKVLATAPEQVWLVLDANSGQNALQQAREFHQALNVNGVVLTKLDGSAKGGVAVAIADELNLPIRFVGLGEKLEDLKPFSSSEFIDAIL